MCPFRGPKLKSREHVSLKFRTLLPDYRARVAQLVEALRYKPEGRGLDSRWCHWNVSLT